MAMNHVYTDVEPAGVEIDALKEPAVIEFGAPWYGYCRATQPLSAALAMTSAASRARAAPAGPGAPCGTAALTGQAGWLRQQKVETAHI